MVCIIGSYKYNVLQIRQYLSAVSGTDVLESLPDSCDMKHLHLWLFLGLSLTMLK